MCIKGPCSAPGPTNTFHTGTIFIINACYRSQGEPARQGCRERKKYVFSLPELNVKIEAPAVESCPCGLRCHQPQAKHSNFSIMWSPHPWAHLIGSRGLIYEDQNSSRWYTCVEIIELSREIKGLVCIWRSKSAAICESHRIQTGGGGRTGTPRGFALTITRWVTLNKSFQLCKPHSPPL